MSAMFAFEVGDVSMRSVTFENVITELIGRSSDPLDREVYQNALDLNCLWVDQIPAPRKCPVLVDLYDVLEGSLHSGAYADNEVAIFEITNVMKELVRRYPQCWPDRKGLPAESPL